MNISTANYKSVIDDLRSKLHLSISLVEVIHIATSSLKMSVTIMVHPFLAVSAKLC